jgi:hypothetical protein
MASITTILGTDSVSSSRIVINNNFNALNTELAQFAAVLNTTAQTLSLNGEVKGGTLRANNGTIDTFKVTNSELIANVESTFNQKAFFAKGIVAAIEDGINSGVTTLPTTGYEAATYILDATASNFANPITLPAAENGQQITFIVSGTPALTGTDQNISPVVAFDANSFEGPTVIEVGEKGSITLVYDGTKFRVVSAMNATITY